MKWQFAAQKKTFSINDFFRKYDQIRSLQQICSHLLKKSLMKNSIFVQWRNDNKPEEKQNLLKKIKDEQIP